MFDDGAAYEHHMREPIEQPEFSDGVGDIDIGAKVRNHVARAQHGAGAGLHRMLQHFHVCL